MSTTALNPERLALVTTALRSGEFPQGRCRLRNHNDPQITPSTGWCCLGVICEVYRRATGFGEWHLSSTEKFYYFVLDGTQYNDYLPPAVWEWLGGSLDDVLSYKSPKWGTAVNPVLAPGRTASGANDSGTPFDQIADGFEAKFGVPA